MDKALEEYRWKYFSKKPIKHMLLYERTRVVGGNVVSDSNKLVQANKIKALGLDQLVKFYYITHRYGIKHAKPSPYCLLKICERERVTPKEVVYIADNPHKDFRI